MTGRSRPLTVVLARRFGRARWLWASSLTVGLTAMLVAAWYCVLQAQSLTGAQLVDQRLGVFSAKAGFGAAAIPPGSAAQAAIWRRVGPIAGPDAQLALLVPELSLPALSDGSVYLTEMRWQPQPFPRKYELLAGRWPQRPGEVAIVNPARADRSAVPRELTAYSGRTRFSVVGTVDDRFSRQVALVAAPGTWVRMPASLESGDHLLRGFPTLYWDGRQSDHVIAMMSVGIREMDGSKRQVKAIEAQVRQDYTHRASVAADHTKSWIAESPAGYTIPSILLPVLAAVVVFTMNRRRLAPAVRVLVAIGTRRHIAVTGVALAVATCCVAAACVGFLVGFLVGSIAARLLSGLMSVPIPTLRNPVLPLSVQLATTLVGCLLGGGMLWKLASDHSAKQTPRATPIRPAGRRRRDARHLIAAVTFGVAALRLRGLSSAPEAMMFAAIVAAGLLLLLPDITPAVLRLLPEQHLRSRLSKRQLLADAPRATTVVAVLGVLLGLSTGFIALLDTMIRTADAQVHPELAPGQLRIADRGTDVLPPPARALAVAKTVPAIADQSPVLLHFLATRPGPGQLGVVANDVPGFIIAVDTPADVERLIGDDLDDSKRATLHDGGLLMWGRTPSSPPAGSAATLRVVRGDRPVARPGTVSAQPIPVPDAWLLRNRTGVMLTTTARQHKLPVTVGAAIDTGISGTDANAVLTALERAGLSRGYATAYKVPPPSIPPLALYLTAVGLTMITLVLTLSLTRGQVRALRDYLGHLVALGIPVRWTRSIVIRQHLTLLAFATVLGLVIGLPPVLLTGWLVPGWKLSIPWSQLGMLVTGIYASVLLATFLASRRVTAQARVRTR